MVRVNAKEKRKGNGAAERPRGRTALITAPVATDTSVIRRILESQGVEAYSADELDGPGRSMSEILQEAVEQADVVVAVLHGSVQSSNVFFELGFAQALNKPAIVIAGEG